MISLPEVVVFLLIAVAIAALWYLMARLIGVLAGLRDQDEDHWFRLALRISPMLAWVLLVTSTPPPRR